MSNADEFMDGQSIKSASFNGPPPIDWAGQIVKDPEMVQKRDFDTNEPVFWPDGRPKEMLCVMIQTDARDPADPDDDGQRALYLEFRKKEAVQEAIKRAGAKGAPKKGGWLRLTYTADDFAAKKGKNAPPKVYVSEYRAPDPWAQEQQQNDGWPAGAQPAQGAPQQGGWGQMPPPGPQAPQQPYGGPPQGTYQGGQPPYQAQQLPGPSQQQYAQAPPPQQQYQQQPAPPAAPAGPDPLVEFLKARNIDASVLPPDQARLIAQNLGYQG